MHPELDVFLILDHAKHTLSRGAVDHGEWTLEFGAALGHKHADRVSALPAAGVEYGNGGEGVGRLPEGMREAVDARILRGYWISS